MDIFVGLIAIVGLIVAAFMVFVSVVDKSYGYVFIFSSIAIYNAAWAYYVFLI